METMTAPTGRMTPRYAAPQCKQLFTVPPCNSHLFDRTHKPYPPSFFSVIKEKKTSFLESRTRFCISEKKLHRQNLLTLTFIVLYCQILCFLSSFVQLFFSPMVCVFTGLFPSFPHSNYFCVILCVDHLLFRDFEMSLILHRYTSSENTDLLKLNSWF